MRAERRATLDRTAPLPQGQAANPNLSASRLILHRSGAPSAFSENPNKPVENFGMRRGRVRCVTNTKNGRGPLNKSRRMFPVQSRCRTGNQRLTRRSALRGSKLLCDQLNARAWVKLRTRRSGFWPPIQTAAFAEALSLRQPSTTCLHEPAFRTALPRKGSSSPPANGAKVPAV